tara:strand:- start:80 stop:181 length:102 start_codon:yes stop_codon:yes gene_type:complete
MEFLLLVFHLKKTTNITVKYKLSEKIEKFFKKT